MTPQEEKRHRLRIRWMTIDLGWPEDRAAYWADMLTVRDREHDDRRMCLECRHLLPQWRCARKGPVLAQMLQRCQLFGWRVP